MYFVSGWLIIGDDAICSSDIGVRRHAFGFLDPMYSTGVFLALKSGEFAADSILAGLEAGGRCESKRPS